MIITRFNLLGANGMFKVVSFEGKYDEPFEFIKKTEYSDYKLVGYDIIDLGLIKFKLRPRITIGKNNCIKDTALYIDRVIPEITDKLVTAFNNKDYESMAVIMNRFVSIVEDLDDMVNELDKIKKSSK